MNTVEEKAVVCTSQPDQTVETPMQKAYREAQEKKQSKPAGKQN